MRAVSSVRWELIRGAVFEQFGVDLGSQNELDEERLYDAMTHWYDGADGGESFRLVPMSSDGGVMPTGDLHPFAAAIAREYAALASEEAETIERHTDHARNKALANWEHQHHVASVEIEAARPALASEDRP